MIQEELMTSTTALSMEILRNNWKQERIQQQKMCDKMARGGAEHAGIHSSFIIWSSGNGRRRKAVFTSVKFNGSDSASRQRQVDPLVGVQRIAGGQWVLRTWGPACRHAPALVTARPCMMGVGALMFPSNEEKKSEKIHNLCSESSRANNPIRLFALVVDCFSVCGGNWTRASCFSSFVLGTRFCSFPMVHCVTMIHQMHVCMCASGNEE